MKLLLLTIGLLQLWNVVSGNWRQDALKLHNVYRAAHGSRPLKLDEDLNTQAQECADRQVELNNGDTWILSHTESDEIGENLAGAYGNKSEAVKQAIKDWYGEKKDYDYSLGVSKNGKDVEHFTQVVWRSSEKLGIGIGYTGEKAFVCAQYVPSGNVENEYLNNVKAK